MKSYEVNQRRRELKRENRRWPAELTNIPESHWPILPANAKAKRVKVFRSQTLLVQIFEESGIIRLSVNRAAINDRGEFMDGFTWDELQKIKAEAGYANWWAVEVYPSQWHVVNVANMRHLWLLPEKPAFAWGKP